MNTQTKTTPATAGQTQGATTMENTAIISGKVRTPAQIHTPASHDASGLHGLAAEMRKNSVVETREYLVGTHGFVVDVFVL